MAHLCPVVSLIEREHRPEARLQANAAADGAYLRSG